MKASRWVSLIMMVVAISFCSSNVLVAKEKVVKEKTLSEQNFDDLQKQIDELKKAVENNQKAPAVTSKFPVELYGFVAAQFMSGTARTQMYGGLNSVAVSSRVLDKTTANGGRHTWFGATPQNSRVGLNWKGSRVSDDLSIGGLVEIDFVNILNNTAYGTSPIPRIRLLYLDLFSDHISMIAGQTWDLYSPLQTASLSLGGNLWYQGNMGFRRPQLRLTYNETLKDINKMKIAVSANLPSNTDDLVYSGGITGNGISSGIPMFELLAQYNRNMSAGDLIVAASGVMGAIGLNGGGYSKIMGIAGSLSVPFHKYFKLGGEVHYGENLGYMLSYVNANGNTWGNKDLAVWGQVTSQWHPKFDTAVGYGIDDIRAAKVVAGNVDRNQIAFANFRFFPVKPFYIGLEYNYMRTAYKGNGTSPASLIFSNFVYNF